MNKQDTVTLIKKHNYKNDGTDYVSIHHGREYNEYFIYVSTWGSIKLSANIWGPSDDIENIADHLAVKYGIKDAMTPPIKLKTTK